MSLVLYWHPMSSATPIACALAELGLPHERIKVDIRAGEQRRPEYLALNPNGKVPTLTVDGQPMFEALAMELWLGEQHGVERGLWPARGTPGQLLAFSWCCWAYVSYGAQVLRRQASLDRGTPEDEHGTEALQALDALLAVLDQHLAQRPWMLGADYSLVDLSVGSVVGYSAYLGAPVARHARVQEWMERLQARPAMRIEA